MKKILSGALLSLVVVLGIGCESKEEQAVKLIEEMAGIFDEHKADCDKMAEALEGFQKKNESKLKSLNPEKMGEGMSEDEKKKFEEKYKTRLEAAMTKMMGGALACMTNEKVSKAMENMK